MKNDGYELARTLGLLGESEARSLQRHLDEAGSAPASEAVRSAADLLAQVGWTAPIATPPASLRQRLRRRLEETAAERRRAEDIQVWKQWSPSSSSEQGPQFVRSGEFEPTGVPGVSVRRLHVDVEKDQATMLVKMEPGSSYPAHRHGGTETCFVVEGDLQVGDEEMAAGDFQSVPEGDVHVVQSTRSGCLLLITSSLHDEILPP